jgi:hypothetical protein
MQLFRKNLKSVRLIKCQSMFENPVEYVRKLISSKLANNMYRIFLLGTEPALARMVTQ